LHDRTFSHLLTRNFEDWLLHRSAGGKGILEFIFSYLRHFVESALPLSVEVFALKSF